MSQETLRLIIFIISIALLIAGVILSFRKTNSLPTYGAAILCLIFVFLPEFKRFEALGVKAELFEKKIQEADEIINRIRSLSLPMAEMIYTMTAQYGRWGAYISNKEKYRIMTKIDEELIRNGVDKEQLEEAKRQWHLYVNIDYSLPIIDHLKGLGSDKIKLNPKDIQLINKIKEAKKELDQYAVIDDFRNLPIFMVNYINSNKLLTDNEKENIFKQFHEEFEDMKYYSIHRKFRRLEKWLEKKY